MDQACVCGITHARTDEREADDDPLGRQDGLPCREPLLLERRVCVVGSFVGVWGVGKRGGGRSIGRSMVLSNHAHSTRTIAESEHGTHARPHTPQHTSNVRTLGLAALERHRLCLRIGVAAVAAGVGRHAAAAAWSVGRGLLRAASCRQGPPSLAASWPLSRRRMEKQQGGACVGLLDEHRQSISRCEQTASPRACAHKGASHAQQVKRATQEKLMMPSGAVRARNEKPSNRRDRALANFVGRCVLGVCMHS